MEKEEYIDILNLGVKHWNKWKKTYPDVKPDLREVDFIGADLRKYDLKDSDLRGAILEGATLEDANLIRANLENAYMRKANLSGANLSGANLFQADLWRANLSRADLGEADLGGAYLREADLSWANLMRADLRGTDLREANLCWAALWETDLHYAKVGATIFGNIDLFMIKGLETIKHVAPSIIGIHVIERSRAYIPEAFLRGVGISEGLITSAHSSVINSAQYYTCFISYSNKDQEFAERLYNDLQGRGVRCWYAPESLIIGAKIRAGIDEAISLHDKLLLILSKNSVDSKWVEQEVETALEREHLENRLVLFPIRLDNAVMEMQGGWPALIHNTRNIGNFSRWKEYDLYQKSFARLLRDLQKKR